MVDMDYIANGRASIKRMRQGAAHLRAYFDAGCKVRDITADRITAYTVARLEEKAKPRRSITSWRS